MCIYGHQNPAVNLSMHYNDQNTNQYSEISRSFFCLLYATKQYGPRIVRYQNCSFPTASVSLISSMFCRNCQDVSIPLGSRWWMITKKLKKQNKKLDPKDQEELNRADINYYLLKKFNFLLMNNNHKLFDVDNEKNSIKDWTVMPITMICIWWS